MSDTKTLHIERTFQAPAEAVFEAFTRPEVMRRWWHAGHDWETTAAEVDLRAGAGEHEVPGAGEQRVRAQLGRQPVPLPEAEVEQAHPLPGGER